MGIDLDRVSDGVLHSIIWAVAFVVILGLICGTLALTAQHVTDEHKATVTACLNQHYAPKDCQRLR